jgi:putative redox protein
MPITVERDQSQPMRHIVHVGTHLISADGTVDEGGTGAGPSPHDLYDAALGACKALTLVWYAKRKGIPVEDIRVTVDRDATQERQGVYRLNTTVHMTGKLSDEQRQEMLTVAQKCPVHKLMTAVTTEITTTLA